MMKLSMVAALVFAVACKTEAPPQSNNQPSSETSSTKPRSAKIDIKPAQPPPAAPSLPAPPAADDTARPTLPPPAADEAMARGEGRRRRDGRFDKDGDGVVSEEEREAGMRDRMTNMRTRLDSDGDGKLSPAELANARGRMRFDDPAALDTNHDGDISADELAAGFRARREQMRNARGSAAAPGASSAPQ